MTDQSHPHSSESSNTLSLSQETLDQLSELIGQCMHQDVHRFKRHLMDLMPQTKSSRAGGNKSNNQRRKTSKPVTSEKLMKWIETSISLRKKREETQVNLTFPEALPVAQRVDEIKAAIKANQVVVVAGETGSGKTTQIPKICLELGLGRKARIGHTQPRRLAASAVASRLAEELNVNLGQEVGYQVRFKDNTSDQTLIKLMTDGVLLNETRFDRYFNKYDCIIIDEAHERSLNIDFLLGYIKRILPKRPDLKVIITSATIDLERFSKHFNNAPIIEVSGRTYPVETLYQPLMGEDTDRTDLDLYQGIVQAVESLEKIEREDAQWARNGDVLVFLPGEREIREAAKELRDHNFKGCEILPLYSRLSSGEQNKIFHPTGSGRRIVLATNVAETSLTVPGIRYVIDSGVARISRYSYKTKVQRLPVEAVSQASANQRKGRCGRLSPGICIRLYSEDDFIQRPEFTDAEIHRTNLATVILQMLDLRLGAIEKFPFVEAPDSRFIKDGYKLLEELGAVQQQELTDIGRQMARLPLDARIARMVIAGNQYNALSEVIIVASVLGLQDPRERPQDKQQQATEKHAAFKDEQSDFVALINLWNAYEEQRQELSNSQLRKWCKKNFIAYMRMREWRDMHRQLHLLTKSLDFKENDQTTSYDALHKSLLTGLLSQVGNLKERKEYQGARQKIFIVGQGTPLAKKTPKWIMAAEMMETQKLYARTVAKIEPHWLEEIAGNLSKRTYSEPHWEKKRGEVVAYERVTLYGLITTARRRTSYQRIDPKLCREIFIRTALVEGDYDSNAAFYQHNRRLVDEVIALEEKTRRRDILIDDDTLFSFYDGLIPEGVTGHIAFEKWRKQKASDNKTNEKRLFLTKEQLLNAHSGELDNIQYPDQLSLGQLKLPLSYAFAPGKENDGVTVKVPLSALKQVPEDGLDWLVPAFLKERCSALIKGLPKQIRRHFVPVPNTVEKVLPKLQQGQGKLTEQLSKHLHYFSAIRISEEDWAKVDVEPHLEMNIELLDDQQKVIDQGRDLHELLQKWGNQSSSISTAASKPEAFDQSGMVDWSFADLPEFWEYQTSGVTVKGFPHIQDDKSSVSIALADGEHWARYQHRFGVARLLQLELKPQLQHLIKNLPKFEKTALCYATLGNRQQLTDDFVTALILNYVDEPQQGLILTKAHYEALLARIKQELFDDGCRFAELLHNIMIKYQALAKKLKGKFSLTTAFIFSDEKKHLSQLIYQGFLSSTEQAVLTNYPRYLDAIEYRLDKLQGNILKAQDYMNTLNDFWQQYLVSKEKNESLHRYDPELNRFRWLIEELRVSYFAQPLGTSEKVSDKRLKEVYKNCLV